MQVSHFHQSLIITEASRNYKLFAMQNLELKLMQNTKHFSDGGPTSPPYGAPLPQCQFVHLGKVPNIYVPLPTYKFHHMYLIIYAAYDQEINYMAYFLHTEKYISVSVSKIRRKTDYPVLAYEH